MRRDSGLAGRSAELVVSLRRARGVDLDLQHDASEVYAYIVSRVSAYTPTDDHGPGGIGPVMMAYAGYNFDQSGWFALVFDRRVDAGHDGEWTRYIEGNTLDRPLWVVAQVRNEIMSLKVRDESGEVRQLPRRSNFGWLLGRMLVSVLQRAEREGIFARLPRAGGFRLGLEEFQGSLGWDSQTGYGGQSQ